MHVNRWEISLLFKMNGTNQSTIRIANGSIDFRKERTSRIEIAAAAYASHYHFRRCSSTMKACVFRRDYTPFPLRIKRPAPSQGPAYLRNAEPGPLRGTPHIQKSICADNKNVRGAATVAYEPLASQKSLLNRFSIFARNTTERPRISVL